MSAAKLAGLGWVALLAERYDCHDRHAVMVDE